MSRLPSVDCARLTPEQKELYDSITGGARAGLRRSLLDENGNLTGPFNAFLHNPALGKHWSAIGEGLRFRSALDKRLFELAVLVVAAEWHAGHEWAAHAGLARGAGVSGEVIASLLRGERPVFDKRDEEIVYGFARELVVNKRVSDEAYGEAASLLGQAQLVELVNALGYYLALAAMLKAFNVHPPKGLDDPWAREVSG